MSIRFDSNNVDVSFRADSTVYQVGDKVNSTDPRVGTLLECSVAGTSNSAEPGYFVIADWVANLNYFSTGATKNNVGNTLPVRFQVASTGKTGTVEPTWNTTVGGITNDGTMTWVTIEWFRMTPNDLSTDGSVVWIAREPNLWSLAMLTAEGAINAWIVASDKQLKIWGELLHFEIASTLTIDNNTDLYNEVPSIYRVDKTTGESSHARTDGTSNINFTSSGGFGTKLSIVAQAHWFGFNFSAGVTFQVSSSADYLFEDCVIEYGITNKGQLYFPGIPTAQFVNCLIKATATADNYINITNDARIKFKFCEFLITTDAIGLLQNLGTIGKYTYIDFDDCLLSGVSTPILVESGSFGAGSAVNSHKGRTKIRFRGCLLPNNYALWDGVWNADMATFVEAEACATPSIGGLYLNSHRNYAGARDTDIALYRTDGYFDPTTGQRLSQTLTPEPGVTQTVTLNSSKIGVLIETPGLKLFTIEILENFTIPLDISKLWVDFYYYKGANDAFHTIDTSTKGFAALSYPTLLTGVGLSKWMGITTGFRSVKLQAVVTIGRIGIAYGIVRLGDYEAGKKIIIDNIFEGA